MSEGTQQGSPTIALEKSLLSDPGKRKDLPTLIAALPPEEQKALLHVRKLRKEGKLDHLSIPKILKHVKKVTSYKGGCTALGSFLRSDG